jgi:hypothetical protein
VGYYAQVFLTAIVLFGVSGLVWGAWRPTITGTIVDGGGVEITDPNVYAANAEFTSFAVLALACGVLGIVLGLLAVRQGKREFGIAPMLWTSLVAALGSAVFYYVGTYLATALVGAPDVETLRVGATVTYVPRISPGLAMLAAPYTSMFTYWASAVFASEEEPEVRTVEAENRHDNVAL